MSRADPSKRDPAAAIIARNGGKPIEATATTKPGDEKKQFAFHSFGAVFAEVHVDADLGTIRVPRIVGVYDVGSLLNEKTAHSQLMGGLVWGIGSALTEKSELDARYGRYTNANLAEYHVPVNADIGLLDITLLGKTRSAHQSARRAGDRRNRHYGGGGSDRQRRVSRDRRARARFADHARQGDAEDNGLTFLSRKTVRVRFRCMPCGFFSCLRHALALVRIDASYHRLSGSRP